MNKESLLHELARALNVTVTKSRDGDKYVLDASKAPQAWPTRHLVDEMDYALQRLLLWSLNPLVAVCSETLLANVSKALPPLLALSAFANSERVDLFRSRVEQLSMEECDEVRFEMDCLSEAYEDSRYVEMVDDHKAMLMTQRLLSTLPEATNTHHTKARL